MLKWGLADGGVKSGFASIVGKVTKVFGGTKDADFTWTEESLQEFTQTAVSKNQAFMDTFNQHGDATA